MNTCSFLIHVLCLPWLPERGCIRTHKAAASTEMALYSSLKIKNQMLHGSENRLATVVDQVALRLMPALQHSLIFLSLPA